MKSTAPGHEIERLAARVANLTAPEVLLTSMEVTGRRYGARLVPVELGPSLALLVLALQMRRLLWLSWLCQGLRGRSGGAIFCKRAKGFACAGIGFLAG